MSAQPRTHYETLGGDAGIRRLVDRFYDLMDTAPEAATIRALHAKSLKASREKLYLFLTGWTGGPQLYVERYGHPRLRMRHFPFAIGAKERDEWLWCMERALGEQEMPPTIRAFLLDRFRALADHMRNQSES
jgi:hemoglobin